MDFGTFEVTHRQCDQMLELKERQISQKLPQK